MKKRSVIWMMVFSLLLVPLTIHAQIFEETYENHLPVNTTSLILPFEDKHAFYNLTVYCKWGICVEGDTAVWGMEFAHYGFRPIEYVDFIFKDSLNHTIVAEHYIDYWPLRDFRGDLLVSEAGKTIKYNITGTLPKQNNNGSLTFYPCYSETVDDIHVFVRNDGYTIETCYDDNWTIPLFECDNSFHCEDDQFCTGDKKCKPLKCDSCQFVQNHQCINYECCANDHCRFDQFCADNKCQNLACTPTQFIFNRTCQELTCNFNEHIVDGACQELTCNQTAYVFNHTCLPLVCGEHEYILNHTCRTCAINQHLVDGVCQKLQCKINEGYKNHKCVQLQCSFYQDIKNHQCENNMGIIIKFSLELIIIIIILIFIAVDIRKAHKIKDDKRFNKTIFINKPEEES